MDADEIVRDMAGFLRFSRRTGRTRSAQGVLRCHSARPVSSRYDRETDRDRSRRRSRRCVVQRVVQRSAETRTAAASVGARGTVRGRRCFGHVNAFVGGDRVARHVGQALGRVIDAHGSEFQEGMSVLNATPFDQ
ncbi:MULTISPECIES: hypothetical protein [Burkholderia]|uniref:Uncharacterized protein n=1 Tax=Burkholderia anthina TaxID=179879 RepID=A0A7T6VJ63_9BURK|nr:MULTISPECIES: hypothetical protein [Burkholderia]QQK04939.1 hypothetical protein JFN94_26880 [Burkholderia anthina]